MTVNPDDFPSWDSFDTWQMGREYTEGLASGDPTYRDRLAISQLNDLRRQIEQARVDPDTMYEYLTQIDKAIAYHEEQILRVTYATGTNWPGVPSLSDLGTPRCGATLNPVHFEEEDVSTEGKTRTTQDCDRELREAAHLLAETMEDSERRELWKIIDGILDERQQIVLFEQLRDKCS